jgi:hypothetical protein
MNLQEHIKRILREERKLSSFLIRRLDMLDYEVEKNLYGSPFGGSNICIFFKSDVEFFESVMENSIDAMYYNHFSHIDDNSGEWAHAYLDMVDYIRNKYKNKIIKHYDDNCGSGLIPLKESIRRVLQEETEGIDSFLDEISSKHNMSDELKDFVKQFIEESDCKRINFSGFKMPAMGLALESGVLINKMALNGQLPFLLFLIFHEVAHQYQFKKYGEDIMYDCYLGDISEREAAEFMKHTEEVADDFASRKIRQLQKLNLIGPYTPPQMYKNVPIQQITMMINNYREDMRRKNIDSPKKVSEYFYNMVKSEL